MPRTTALRAVRTAHTTRNTKLSEKLLAQHPPVGKLAEKHPTLLFAVVHKLPDGRYVAGFMGDVQVLSAGTKVALWGGEVVVA